MTLFYEQLIPSLPMLVLNIKRTKEDFLKKKGKTQKIFEKYPALSDMFAILPLREYFKNYHAPARDGTIQPIWITRIVSYGKYKGAFTAKEIREYFKNIPPIKDNKWSKRYLQSKKS